MSPSDLAGAAGVREGDVLAGKYRVDRVLGMGGMGVVVAAHHVQLDTKVALKFLLPAMLNDTDTVARFAREARAAAKITNEHVARVLDVGTLENGAPYIVMEFLEGGDLAAWLQQRGPLPVDQAVDFVLQASVAVAEAHSLSIVHRDLKPANLFCLARSDGQLQIKVLDFGISKFNDVGSAHASGPAFSATRTNTVMGSPLYMSPEQLQTPKEVDARTDIWALGVILYELLTGRVPFLGETLADVAIKIVTGPPAPLRESRAEAPAALDAVIRKCLAKSREERYGSVGDLAMDLLPFAPRRSRASVERIGGIMQSVGKGSGAFPRAPSARETQAVPAGSWPPGTIAPVQNTRGAGGKRSPRVTALGGAVAAVVVLGLAGGAVLLRRSHSASAPPMATVVAAPSMPAASELAPPPPPSPPPPPVSALPAIDAAALAPKAPEVSAPSASASASTSSAHASVAANRAVPTLPLRPVPQAAVKVTPAPAPVPATPAAPRPSADVDPLARLKPKF